MKQNIKAKGHYTYEYISKVKGQGRQYPHTADMDLGSVLLNNQSVITNLRKIPYQMLAVSLQLTKTCLRHIGS